MGQAEDQALRQAILDYDLEEAERLLRLGANPNVLIGSRRARSPFSTPGFVPNQFRGLHLAANDDDPELAALLLLHGANAHQKIYAGVLPLSIAAQSNHLAVAEVLLHEYRRPAGAFGFCPLALAAYNGHLQLVELLLAKKPEEMAVDPALKSAVARKGNLAVTERLLAAGARADWVHPGVDPKDAVTARMVALHPQPEALPLLLGHGHVRLIDAAVDGDLAAVERFLSEGASPDDADPHGYTTALSAASRTGQTAVVRRLLDAGARLRGPKRKSDPLFQALRGAHTETADLLWERRARTERMLERTILYGAPIASVQWAFDREPNPNGALYDAVRAKRIDVARFALDRGADPSHQRHGRSPSMVAASRKHLEMLELLLTHGAELDAVDDQGWTAMHYALFGGDPDDPEETFGYAASAPDSPVAKLLLRHGLAIPPRS